MVKKNDRKQVKLQALQKEILKLNQIINDQKQKLEEINIKMYTTKTTHGTTKSPKHTIQWEDAIRLNKNEGKV